MSCSSCFCALLYASSGSPHISESSLEFQPVHKLKACQSIFLKSLNNITRSPSCQKFTMLRHITSISYQNIMLLSVHWLNESLMCFLTCAFFPSFFVSIFLCFFVSSFLPSFLPFFLPFFLLSFFLPFCFPFACLISLFLLYRPHSCFHSVLPNSFHFR